jgi:hypothetical protein
MSDKCTLKDIYSTGGQLETGRKIRLGVQFTLTLLVSIGMAIPTAIVFWDTEATN